MFDAELLILALQKKNTIMKTQLIFTLLIVLVCSFVIQAQIKVEEPNYGLSAAGQTVLLGTYTWDAETDSFPSFGKAEEKKGDIWWQQETENKQSLVPRNGALIIELRGKDFGEFTIEDLKYLKYSLKPIPNEALVPNAVFGLLTPEGNYAILKIVGYRALHDFSFKEAAVLRESWKTFVLNKTDRENYHLEVEWVLYTKQ
jgi:hypothetical protein